MALGQTISRLFKKGLSQLPFTAEMRVRKFVKQAKHWSIYLREGEEGLGRFINQSNDRTFGAGVDARLFEHPKLPALLTDIEQMATKARIRVKEVVARMSPHGSPLSADYQRIHIDPNHLDKYTPAELKAIARHELEHIRNNDIIHGALGARQIPMEARADIAAVRDSGEPEAFIEVMKKTENKELADISHAQAVGDHETANSLSHTLRYGDSYHPPTHSRIRLAKKWADMIKQEAGLSPKTRS